mmetsp:Transcript_29637/g.55107  ORF Transcript_29637/g.55107 Transcript_29637/m.55107 type:complete len:81 (-) Transcript_29637:22-264(-)
MLASSRLRQCPEQKSSDPSHKGPRAFVPKNEGGSLPSFSSVWRGELPMLHCGGSLRRSAQCSSVLRLTSRALFLLFVLVL